MCKFHEENVNEHLRGTKRSERAQGTAQWMQDELKCVDALSPVPLTPRICSQLQPFSEALAPPNHHHGSPGIY